MEQQEPVQISQPVAMYESGQPRSQEPLTLQTYKNEDGIIIATGSDEIYDYEAATNPEVELTGTIFIKNKRTGAIKAVPVETLLQIRKLCKVHEYESVGTAQPADSVRYFGSRAAQKIYSQRAQRK